MRFIAGQVSGDVAALEYFCAAPFHFVESTGGPARKRRVRQHGASPAIHRETSGGTALPGARSPGGEYQPALLLQDVQESDGNEFHRLSLESPSGEIEDTFAQSQLPH